MKNLSLLAAGLLWAAAVVAGESPPSLAAEDSAAKNAPKGAPVFSWSLLWSGSWEESKTLHNRGEVKLNFLPPALTLRGEVLDRRTLNFELDSPFGDPKKAVTNFAGGLYHKPTGSRLLYGVLDEYGLSARVRNPWVRSPPYAENHMPLMADLKTAASGTKEDEVYMYLSTPVFNLPNNVRLRGFASAQSQAEYFSPAVSGGLDFAFAKKNGLLLEAFYTGAQLPPTKGSTWFSYPPPLPEREFDLFAFGFHFYNPLISVSGDGAFSETFAWGRDFYGNLGVSISPKLPFGSRERPLSVSLAVDGAGERFIYRDGANHGEGFRTAGKIEWKGRGNSLFRINSVLRSPGVGEAFNRSSSGIYYRFPALKSKGFPVRPTRVSFNMDRNAVNSQKINDSFSSYLGLSIRLPGKAKNSPLGVNLYGFLKGISVSEGRPSPYPFSRDSWLFDNGGGSCELVWSPLFLQFKTKFGYTAYEKKDNKWEFSVSAGARFKYGRFSLKASSPDFPEKWNWTLSWRLEKPEKHRNSKILKKK